MIYYKVSITLTVIFIISCSGFNVEECKECLEKNGFSDVFGFINYCFAKQFVNLIQFENFIEIVYEYTTVQENLYTFFETNRTDYDVYSDDLNDPATFCKNYSDPGDPECEKNIIHTDNGKYDTENELCEIVIINKKCEKNIIHTDNGKYDTENELCDPDENEIQNIKYGKNKFKNAIKSYNLSLEDYSKINDIMETWHESKKKYYHNLVDTLNTKKKCATYFTTETWCTTMEIAAMEV